MCCATHVGWAPKPPPANITCDARQRLVPSVPSNPVPTGTTVTGRGHKWMSSWAWTCWRKHWCNAAPLAGKVLVTVVNALKFGKNGAMAVLDGWCCVALGHGLRGDPVVEHSYFGTSRVLVDLEQLPGFETGEVVLQQGVLLRDPATGLVVGMAAT